MYDVTKYLDEHPVSRSSSGPADLSMYIIHQVEWIEWTDSATKSARYTLLTLSFPG